MSKMEKWRGIQKIPFEQEILSAADIGDPWTGTWMSQWHSTKAYTQHLTAYHCSARHASPPLTDAVALPVSVSYIVVFGA